jgi:DNA-binding beta-propeller fold protein YncE
MSNSPTKCAVIALAIFAAIPAGAQTPMQRYAAHDSAASAARKAHDWSEYQKHVVVLDSILGGHPNVQIVSARIASHLGDTATAYSRLRVFAAMGLQRNIEADSDLVALKSSPTWKAINDRLASNGNTIGAPTPAFAMPDSDFVAEDIAWDPIGKRWLVTGIRRSVIVAVDRDGKQQTFSTGPDKGYGYLALAVDSARGVIWATAEAIPLALGFDTTMAGRASIFRYDLRSGQQLARYDMTEGERHGAGDIAVGENGDLFIADAADRSLHVIRSGSDRIDVFIPRGEFFSPQGPAVAKDGKHLYLADYGRGIARIDRSTGGVEWVSHPENVALNGIDGLTAVDSRTLIGVQNGTNPNRVIRISLDDSGKSVSQIEVIAQNKETIREPTHGVLVGRHFYFIGNGGYGSFDDKGNLAAGERAIAPVILKLSNVR